MQLPPLLVIKQPPQEEATLQPTVERKQGDGVGRKQAPSNEKASKRLPFVLSPIPCFQPDVVDDNALSAIMNGISILLRLLVFWKLDQISVSLGRSVSTLPHSVEPTLQCGQEGFVFFLGAPERTDRSLPTLVYRHLFTNRAKQRG